MTVNPYKYDELTEAAKTFNTSDAVGHLRSYRYYKMWKFY